MYVRAHAQLSRYPKTLIYPIPPEKGGVGVHTCPDLHGGMRLGPIDKRLLDVDMETTKWDYNVEEEVKIIYITAIYIFMAILWH